MNNRDINAKFSRIIRMIEEIRDLALDETMLEEIASGNTNTLQTAIDMLSDDIHDCENDSFESSDNPHCMTEDEYFVFLTLVETMRS